MIRRLSELIRDRREAFMKKDKLKSVVLKFSIVFFIVIALLTYFLPVSKFTELTTI